jgi:serine/threonine protein phosphatase PrpC
MKYGIFQESRIGARHEQQDRLGHWATGEALALALADGMGGHAHGEIAAQIAVEYLGAAFRAEAKPRLPDPEMFLYRAIGRAHALIVHQGQKMALPDWPRTTVVACVVQGGRAWWSYIGDSRLYHIRDGRVAARTRDHTLVQQLVDAGRIREEAVAAHPDRNKLLRCLGGPIAPRIEPAASAPLAKDDILLLCSDGFWGPLTQRQILTGLIGRAPGEALPALMQLAESAAGRACDNLSVLALHWLEEAAAEPEPPRAAPQAAPPPAGERFTTSASDFLRTTDAEIERQIAQMKDAAQQPGPPKRGE